MYVCFQLIVVIGYDCLVDKINYILSPCVTHSSAILPVLYHTGGVMPAGRVVAFDFKFLVQSAIIAVNIVIVGVRCRAPCSCFFHDQSLPVNARTDTKCEENGTFVRYADDALLPHFCPLIMRIIHTFSGCPGIL